MIGIAIKKVNSAAERLSVPSSSEPTIVAPEREGHRVWSAVDSIDALTLLYDELDAYLTGRLDG